MQQTHKVYFIGAGPGNPEHLTIGGARALTASQLVFAAQPFEQTFAPLLAGKEVLVPFDYYFAELISLVRQRLETTSVAFLVPGDLTFYSPFQGLIDAFAAQAEIIPGVGTANVASARLQRTFDLPGKCNRTILASPRTLGDGPDAPTLGSLAAPGVTLLIYMNNLPLPELVAQLRIGYGRNVPIAICHRLDLPGEEIVSGSLDDIVERVGERDFFNLSSTTRRPALTLVVVGETLSGEVDGTWWDWRREHIWQWREGGE